MIEVLLAGLAGLLIGSFLNVCIYRLPRDESIVRPRSHCPECRQPIASYDNIPIVSWLLLRRRCRHCKTPISPRYPAVELATGVLFAAGVWVLGPSAAALKYCLFAAVMVDLIVTDFEARILPDEFTLGGTLAGAACAAWVPIPDPLLPLLVPEPISPLLLAVSESALTAGFLAGMLWSVGALYARLRGREGLGLGDVKMVACLGAFLGLSQALLAITFGSILGSIAGLAYISFAKKNASTYELPFGSFLGIGALLVALIRPGL